MTALLVCPVCEESSAEPCEDVIAAAVIALFRVGDAAAFAERLGVNGGVPSEASVAVPLLVAQPWWPDALAEARAHDGTGCDPAECDACVSQRSVMQVNCWYWRTLERAAT